MTRLEGRSLILIVAGATLAADQFTKFAIVRSMMPGVPVPVVPGLFDFTLVTNAGGIFGVLRQTEGPLRNVLFSVIPIVAIILMGWYGWQTRDGRAWSRAGLGLILGGAIGNLSDRLRLGHVIDFLDAYIGTHHWPAFNVADSAICVGVTILLAAGFFAHDSNDPTRIAGSSAS